MASGADHGLAARPLERGALDGIPVEIAGLADAETPATETARGAILDCVAHSCRVPLAEALDVQAKHSAGFMLSPACRQGRVGAEQARTQRV